LSSKRGPTSDADRDDGIKKTYLSGVAEKNEKDFKEVLGGQKVEQRGAENLNEKERKCKNAAMQSYGPTNCGGGCERSFAAAADVARGRGTRKLGRKLK